MDIREKLASMTLEQKLGHVTVCRLVNPKRDMDDYFFDKLHRGCIGAIQGPTGADFADNILKIKAEAPNPILICADMESGFPRSERRLPLPMAIAAADNDELAYEFGRITGIEAKAAGFNLVWGPVVDLLPEDAQCKVQRTLGGDPQKTARLARQIVRGYTDCGMMYTAKHYPDGSDVVLDSHLFSPVSALSEKELLEYDLVPYLELMKHENLAGIMSTHNKFPKIDPDYPASLSEKVISIIRRAGFDGMMITDSFAMMGIIDEFGEEGCVGRAIAAGNDLLLPNYRISYKQTMEYMENAYRNGVFSEERLNEAVRRVLEAQEKAAKPCPYTELSDFQLETLERINSDSVCEISDNVPPLDRNAKHLFVVLKENVYERGASGVTAEISPIRSWFPSDICETLMKDFPNSVCVKICEFPNQDDMHDISYRASLCDDVVFVTFCKGACYTATDGFTERFIMLTRALKDRTAAILHIGNPFALEKLPHIPRKIIGFAGGECEKYALEILAGKREAKGKLPIDVHFN